MDVEEYSNRVIQFYSDQIPSLLNEYLESINWRSYLDVGCGDGQLLYALSRKGFFQDKYVYAADMSKNRISRIRKINDSIQGYINDACDLKDIHDQSIDFLVSTQVIEHVPDDEKMIREAQRVMTHDGHFYLTTVFKK